MFKQLEQLQINYLELTKHCRLRLSNLRVLCIEELFQQGGETSEIGLRQTEIVQMQLWLPERRFPSAVQHRQSGPVVVRKRI